MKPGYSAALTIFAVSFFLMGSQSFAQDRPENFIGSWRLIAEGDGNTVFPSEQPENATATDIVVIRNDSITYINHIVGTVLPAEGPINCATISTDALTRSEKGGYISSNNPAVYVGTCPERMKSYTFSAVKIVFERESATRIKVIFTREKEQNKTWIYFLEK